MKHDIFKMALNLHKVSRWHIIGALKRQSVAEHSFNVALIASWVYLTLCDNEVPETPEHFEQLSEILMYALVHDCEESIYGDMPSPSRCSCHKSSLPEPGHKYTLPVVKLADLLEALMWVNYNDFDPNVSAIKIDVALRMDSHIRSLEIMFPDILWDKIVANIISISRR